MSYSTQPNFAPLYRRGQLSKQACNGPDYMLTSFYIGLLKNTRVYCIILIYKQGAKKFI